MPMLTKTPSDLKAARPPAAPTAKRPRDPRLDVFRGIGMMIILIAHVPNNPWILWIPARFGFSDATEMFVFLSGMASALAFGRIYDRDGFLMGIGRTAHRIWQVYWTHVLVFVVVVALMVAAGTKPDGTGYPSSLNLMPFLDDPGPQLLGLLTLSYVPNYFDILPMYLVILALMPVMLGLERLHRAAPFVAMGAIWLMAQAGVNLPAEPWSDRPWYFNPFGWQLLFFLGFFLMRRTLVPPPRTPALMALAAVIVIATVPFAWYVALNAVPVLAEAANTLRPLTDKTTFGLLRLVHFLALAYLAVHLVGEGGRRLKGPAVTVISVVGQQSLAVFVAGMVTAQVIGIALDHTGRTGLTVAAGNLAGMAVLVAVAYAVRWFKASPWKG